MIEASEVIESVTLGGRSAHGKTRLQALCAAIQSPSQLEPLLVHLSKDNRLSNVTDKVLAFRTESEEGFDDGCTLAAGEKLLHMLERMNVENIVVMVFLWDYGYVGKLGTELYKAILDKARELLLKIHSRIFSVKNQRSERRPVTSTCFSFEPLPGPPVQSKKEFRPRHFMTDVVPQKPEPVFEEPDITETDLYNAVNQVENSLRYLSQSDIIDLRHIHQTSLCAKVLIMVAVLKGYIAPTWANVKHMLENRTFKIELSLVDVKKLTKKQVHLVRKIQSENKGLTVQNISNLSVPTATLLSWVEGILIWHAGRNLVKASPSAQTNIAQVLEYSEPLAVEPEIQEKKMDPELESKLKKAREQQVEYEQRIDRILKTRLEEVNFEEEDLELTDTDIMKYLNTQNIQDQPTSTLLAIVRKLKERRMN